MPKASVKRIINKKKDKLIEFVLDIEKYPEFIPFCLGSKVYERKEEGGKIFIIADLTIGKGRLTPLTLRHACDITRDHSKLMSLGQFEFGVEGGS